jgi:uncharacterized protein YbjT (DUF2867 family)
MRPKIITILGATGAQGGSVINTLLASSSPSQYTIRALSRTPTTPSAQALTTRGIEVVRADAGDLASLKTAFAGSYAVFGVTDFWAPFARVGPAKALEQEIEHGMNIAKAASETEGLEHFIWSSLPDAATITGGKYRVPHFEAKAKVDEYIRGNEELRRKTTFLWVCFYTVSLRRSSLWSVAVMTERS